MGGGILPTLFSVLVFVLSGSSVWATPSDDLRASLQPTADVNDFAGILSPAEKNALEQRCLELRQRTGGQLAVVVLRSLQGGEVDDFTEKLFQQWGVGQADKKNGVMLLVALDDRKARIEVGYGLEPVLPDALAGRILQQQLFPAFKQQQYGSGLTAAVNRIAEIVEKNEPAPRIYKTAQLTWADSPACCRFWCSSRRCRRWPSVARCATRKSGQFCFC